MDIDALLNDLVALARRQPSLDLVQFKTLVSAEQYRRLYELVERHVPGGGAVLDWGCGNGHTTYALSALGYEPHAYSIDPVAPPLAQLGLAGRFTASMDRDVVRLPFDTASFDAVLSVGVLEHVRETGGTEIESLAEIRRVLKPAGVFVCYHLPNQYSYIDAVAKLLPNAHHHEFRFTRDSIVSMCESAGFGIVEMARYAALPRNPWQLAPARLGNSRRVARAWNKLDRWAEALVSPIVQNYYFVARPRQH